MPRPAPAIGVLADDLTGALASAGLLAEAGLRPAVQWRQQEPPVGATALVADMRTRDYGTEPGRRAESWAAHLRALRCRRIELRIDSTLRGAPAEELAATVKATGWDDARILAVPGFPSAGRTVRDGRLHATALPEAPIEVAPLVFGGTAGVATVDIEVIEQGVDAVVTTIRNASAARFVADATSESHLATLAAAADTLAQDARGLLSVSPGAWLRYQRPARPRPYLLVVLSSNTATNHEQLHELRARHASTVVHARALLGGESPVDWHAVRSGTDVVVVETISRPAADAADAWLQSTMAARAAGYLLDDAAQHDLACAGIIVGGGQTGSALMDALGAGRLDATGEAAPLCPRGTVADGEWAGTPVITKGGLVGGRSTLADLAATLRKEMP